MTFLPLIERELRLRARTPAAYWTRFVVGLLGVFICLPQFTSLGMPVTPAMIGRGVFHGLVSAGFLLICAVCLLMVGALNDEQREGTLGLLLLTRVRTLDVLLGKLGSIGLTSACVLLAFLPMLMLPLLSGGVSGGEVVRKGLGLLTALGFALAAGLFASACQRERMKAVWLAIGIVGTVALAPFLAGIVLGHSSISTVPPIPVRLSPVVLLISAGDLPYRASPSAYWTSMAMLIVLSGLLLAGACVRLRRALRGEGDAVVSRAAASSDTTQPSARGWHSVAARVTPVAWRVSRQRGLYASVWAAAVLGTLYHLLFGFISAWLGLRSVALASWSFSFASGAITASLCAWAASRFFVESRRTGELELLLTTPVGAQTIISDQWTVLKRVIRWPVVFMLAPIFLQGFVFFLMAASRVPQLAAYRVHYLVYLPFEVLNTILAMVALCWVSLWFGARAAGQARAILWSVAAARAVPYGVSVLFSVVLPMFLTPRPQPLSALNLTMSLLNETAAMAYFAWLIWLSRRCLPTDLATARPMQFDWRRVFASRLREARLTFRAVRHWTAS
jgi:hypothetical protein